MPDNVRENLVGATRIGDEKPKLPELVIDGECVPSVGEVNPSLGNLVSDKVRDLFSSQMRQMVAKPMPQRALRQRGELPRTIVHGVVEKCDAHETCEAA